MTLTVGGHQSCNVSARTVRICLHQALQALQALAVIMFCITGLSYQLVT